MDEPRALELLSQHVWEERRVVTHLLYRLTVAKLLLAADDRRFVAEALGEVDQTLAALRAGEANRDEALRDLAEAWQVDPHELSLPELARRSPAPYDYTFGEHLAAFQELAAEIEEVAGQNRSLAAAGFQQVSRTIESMTGSAAGAPATYDAHGQLDPTGRVGRRLREAL